MRRREEPEPRIVGDAFSAVRTRARKSGEVERES